MMQLGAVDMLLRRPAGCDAARLEVSFGADGEAIAIDNSWPRHPLLLAPPDSLGLVEGHTLELPEPESPWHLPFLAECRQRLDGSIDAKSVRDAAGLARRLRGEVGGLGDAEVLGVYGGAGSGRSTVVVALALALQGLGRSVAILDADLGAPNLKQRLGLDHPPILVENLVLTLPWHGIRVQSLATFWPEAGPLPWQGLDLRTVLRRFQEDVLWGRPDVLLLDLPAIGDPRLETAIAAFNARPIAVHGPLASAVPGPGPVAVIGQAGGEGDVQLPYAPPGERLLVLASLLRPFAASACWKGSGSSQ